MIQMTVSAAMDMGAAVPAAGSLPPGTGKLTTLTSWVTGLVGLALFIGFLAALGQTGIKALSHGHFTGGMGAVVCLVCAVFLGAASAIFAVLGINA